jgi:hypothetical protein
VFLISNFMFVLTAICSDFHGGKANLSCLVRCTKDNSESVMSASKRYSSMVSII